MRSVGSRCQPLGTDALRFGEFFALCVVFCVSVQEIDTHFAHPAKVAGTHKLSEITHSYVNDFKKPELTRVQLAQVPFDLEWF